MKAALTAWQGRIAPVFDVAGTALIFEPDNSGGLREESVSLPEGSPHSKLAFLKDRKIDVLICGAMTRRVQEQAEALGIRVNPFVSGEIRDVWEAWQNGGLEQACYSMPGCGRCRRREGRCRG